MWCRPLGQVRLFDFLDLLTENGIFVDDCGKPVGSTAETAAALSRTGAPERHHPSQHFLASVSAVHRSLSLLGSDRAGLKDASGSAAGVSLAAGLCARGAALTDSYWPRAADAARGCLLVFQYAAAAPSCRTTLHSPALQEPAAHWETPRRCRCRSSTESSLAARHPQCTWSTLARLPLGAVAAA